VYEIAVVPAIGVACMFDCDRNVWEAAGKGTRCARLSMSLQRL